MSATNEIQIVLLVELLNDIGTKCVRNPTLILAPSCHFFIRVTPKKIAEETVVGDITWAVEVFNLL